MRHVVVRASIQKRAPGITECITLCGRYYETVFDHTVTRSDTPVTCKVCARKRERKAEEIATRRAGREKT